MRRWLKAGSMAIAVVGGAIAVRTFQSPAVLTIPEAALREYAGPYQWDGGGFVYMDMWAELSATSQLVAFDEAGEIRTLYPTEPDRFFTGPGAGVSTSIESRIEFQRDGARAVTALSWRREAAAPRIARRVAIETRERVEFSSGTVRLAGTLVSPAIEGRRPAIVLVHGSGPASREQVFPFARALIRHGITVLGYDKRGVGGSTGDWNAASFDDLAGDAMAAVEYLKTRADIDPARIGLLGWSQAGWIMPLAAVRRKDIAFVISLSGPALPAAETTLDQAGNEMSAGGMKPPVVARILGLMKLQYAFARTGQGWDEYAAARAEMAARMGTPPSTFPGTPDDPYWGFMRRLYFYDPVPTLSQLRAPTLALFGELDNNIVAQKHTPAWESALKAAGNRDYTLRVLPKANHAFLAARVGSNAEMPSLPGFVPELRPALLEWLRGRLQLPGPR